MQVEGKVIGPVRVEFRFIWKDAVTRLLFISCYMFLIPLHSMVLLHIMLNISLAKFQNSYWCKIHRTSRTLTGRFKLSWILCPYSPADLAILTLARGCFVIAFKLLATSAAFFHCNWFRAYCGLFRVSLNISGYFLDWEMFSKEAFNLVPLLCWLISFFDIFINDGLQMALNAFAVRIVLLYSLKLLQLLTNPLMGLERNLFLRTSWQGTVV